MVFDALVLRVGSTAEFYLGRPRLAASTQDCGLRWAVIVTHRRPSGIEVIGSLSTRMGAPSAPQSRVSIAYAEHNQRDCPDLVKAVKSG